MSIEPLTLKHQVLLSNRFHVLNIPVSEYSFSNLYLFRNTYHYQIITVNQEPFITGVLLDGTSFIMPTSSPFQIPLETLIAASSTANCFYPIPTQWLPAFDKIARQTNLKEDDMDYLFTKEKMTSYPGRHLSKKRNLVKQLLSNHHIEEEALTKGNAIKALEVLERWHSEHPKQNIEDDYVPCREGLELIEPLHLQGRIIRVDQSPAGFIIGEKIAQDCFVTHFCKASPLLHGLYQYLYQDLAQSLDSSYFWINLEQDLGIPTLRQSKHSYQPDQLLIKWRVWTL